MRRATTVVAMLAGLLLAGSPPAQAQEPPGKKSDQVEHVGFLAEPNVISARFDTARDLMYLSTLRGLAIYDVKNPEKPERLSFYDLPHFQNEDVDFSGDKLLISNDPSEGVGTLYVISVADPRNPVELGRMTTGTAIPTDTPFGFGTGHTASCVDRCRYAYLAGTFTGIDIVDLTDPTKPRYAVPSNFPAEEAAGGLATHDVQFDQQGLAWIAGGGGTAAYDVSNPLAPRLVHRTNEVGDSRYDETFGNDDGSTYNDFIHHNSIRLTNSSLAEPKGPLAADSDVVAITEEDQNRPACRGGGSLQTWRITGDTLVPLSKFEAEVDPTRTTLCSAHYFDVRGGLVAQGWYEQGIRFLDVSRPEEIRQVGFYIPQKNLMWGAYFVPTDPTGEVVYALDTSRGVDILRFDRPDGGPGNLPTVVAPQADGPGAGGQAGGGGASATRPNVRARLTNGRAGVRRRQRLRYRVTVQNTSSVEARGVLAVVDLPRAARLVRGSARGAQRRGRRLIYVVGPLAAGQSRSFRFKLRVRHRRGAVLVLSRAIARDDADPADDRARDRDRIRRRGPVSRAAADHALALANARMTTVRAPVTRRMARAVKSAYGYVCRLVT